jgi:hypothetical protein
MGIAETGTTRWGESRRIVNTNLNSLLHFLLIIAILTNVSDPSFQLATY